MYISLHIKVAVIFVRFQVHLNFEEIFFKKINGYQISRKSIQWEPSGRTAGQRKTDRHGEANCCFSQFCESALKKKEQNL